MDTKPAAVQKPSCCCALLQWDTKLSDWDICLAQVKGHAGVTFRCARRDPTTDLHTLCFGIHQEVVSGLAVRDCIGYDLQECIYCITRTLAGYQSELQMVNVDQYSSCEACRRVAEEAEISCTICRPFQACIVACGNLTRTQASSILQKCTELDVAVALQIWVGSQATTDLQRIN